jgi:plasmid stability protein
LEAGVRSGNAACHSLICSYVWKGGRVIPAAFFLDGNAERHEVIAMLSLAMASITIRRLDDSIKSRLKRQAVRHGRSMEEEAREILRAGLKPAYGPKSNLAESIRRYVQPFGGVELALPRREAVRRPPTLAS